MVLPSFLHLSPAETELFISLIKTNIAATFINEITELVIELNENFIVEITSSSIISQNIIDEQIEKIKHLTTPITKLYLDKWISINSNYAELLDNLLKNDVFCSLSQTANLDEFMIKVLLIDNSIPKDHLDMLKNTNIPSTKRFFNYVVIKTADYLGSKFVEKQLFIAESICKEIFTKSSLPKVNSNPVSSFNKQITPPRNWKLEFI